MQEQDVTGAKVVYFEKFVTTINRTGIRNAGCLTEVPEISVNTFGSIRWILFAVQILPILVLLAGSDLPILPFGQISKESTAFERKIRIFENKLFKDQRLFKLLNTTFYSH